MNFELYSNKNTYEWNEKSVFGEIFIQIDKHLLPEHGWNDIVSSVLDMWVSNLIHFLKQDVCGQEDFYFMDGPFFYRIIGNGSNTVEISLYANHRLIPNSTYGVSFQEMLVVIIKLINEIIRDEQLEKVHGIKMLSRNFMLLKKMIRKKHILLLSNFY